MSRAATTAGTRTPTSRRSRTSAWCRSTSPGTPTRARTASTRTPGTRSTRCGSSTPRSCGAPAASRPWSSGTRTSPSSRSCTPRCCARASSSRRPRARRRRRREVGVPESPATLERWMQLLLTHPDGPGAGASSAEARATLAATIPDVFLPSRELSSEARVGVYAEMYFARLIEVLEEEFPVLAHLCGHARAHALFRAYLIAHPSKHYSLNALGKALPAFVRDEAGELEERGFAFELARLER